MVPVKKGIEIRIATLVLLVSILGKREGVNQWPNNNSKYCFNMVNTQYTLQKKK